jgi:hypothetical protein
MRSILCRRLIRATLFCLCSFGSLAFAENGGDWVPDVATVNHVEELLRKMPPPTYGTVKSDSFDSYGRYYTGHTNAGRKQIFASFYSADPKQWPPGVHIGSPHYMMSGGGCHNLIILYDVAEDRIKQYVCYGLG